MAIVEKLSELWWMVHLEDGDNFKMSNQTFQKISEDTTLQIAEIQRICKNNYLIKMKGD